MKDKIISTHVKNDYKFNHIKNLYKKPNEIMLKADNNTIITGVNNKLYSTSLNSANLKTDLNVTETTPMGVISPLQMKKVYNVYGKNYSWRYKDRYYMTCPNGVFEVTDGTLVAKEKLEDLDGYEAYKTIYSMDYEKTSSAKNTSNVTYTYYARKRGKSYMIILGAHNGDALNTNTSLVFDKAPFYEYHTTNSDSMTSKSTKPEHFSVAERVASSDNTQNAVYISNFTQIMKSYTNFNPLQPLVGTYQIGLFDYTTELAKNIPAKIFFNEITSTTPVKKSTAYYISKPGYCYPVDVTNVGFVDGVSCPVMTWYWSAHHYTSYTKCHYRVFNTTSSASYTSSDRSVAESTFRKSFLLDIGTSIKI